MRRRAHSLSMPPVEILKWFQGPTENVTGKQKQNTTKKPALQKIIHDKETPFFLKGNKHVLVKNISTLQTEK